MGLHTVQSQLEETEQEWFRNAFAPLDWFLQGGAWGPVSGGRNELSSPWHSKSRGGLGRKRVI